MPCVCDTFLGYIVGCEFDLRILGAWVEVVLDIRIITAFSLGSDMVQTSIFSMSLSGCIFSYYWTDRRLIKGSGSNEVSLFIQTWIEF